VEPDEHMVTAGFGHQTRQRATESESESEGEKESERCYECSIYGIQSVATFVACNA